MREPDMKCQAEVTEVPERENAEEPTQFRVLESRAFFQNSKKNAAERLGEAHKTS